MDFKDYLKTRLRRILGFSLLAAVLSLAVFPGVGTYAAEPRFNFLDGDYELLRGKNVTEQEAVLKDPVTGEAGDIFQGVIYYHNGEADTVALNTTIHVNIPERTIDNTAVLTATIDADNTQAVTSTIVDGETIGRPGLTVVLNQDAALELVPGSVQWFPNVNQDGDAVLATPLPGGQTGDSIDKTGISIGDIQGCWPFAGFVAFKFKTIPLAVPTLTIDKTVRNVSKGESSFVDLTTAVKDEVVEFKIDVVNNGNVVIDDAVLKDVLPEELELLDGSVEHVATNSNPVLLPSDEVAQLFTSGRPFGDVIDPGIVHTFTFKAKVVAVVSEITLAVNKAIVIFDNESIEDTATVKIVPVVANIVKNKKAVNNTSGKVAELQKYDSKDILGLEAQPGDEITYTLTTRNIGTGATEFVVEDGIADILEYANVILVSHEGEIVTGTTGNEAKLVQYPAVVLNPGEVIERTFKVKVKNPLPNNPPSGYSYDDKMFNKYGDIVIVFIQRPVIKIDLSMNKVVRNFTAGQAEFVEVTEAFAGDTVEFRINFSNRGNAPADQVRIIDQLPSEMLYLEGTTTVSRNGSMEKTLVDGITGAGVVLGTIAPGESGYLKFKAMISSKLAVGSELVNKAVLEDDNVTLTDTAKVVIKARPIVKPPVDVPMLPKTGAAASASFLITFMAGVMFTYFKYRRIIQQQLEIVQIANSVRSL
ncbi:MAG: hypothetical protein BWY68_00246 [bacterium ADurb.Bin400]|nr:MAG: hypothetical protein BWY68_00246 [bacterium ADurb.Bin400]